MSQPLGYGPPQGAAELEALAGIRAVSFDISPEYTRRSAAAIGPDATRCMRVGGTLVGGGSAIRIGHWFGGRCVPSAGVLGVAIAPEHRSRGYGRDFMRRFCRELAAEPDGPPISTLFPSTPKPYRDIGYGVAGTTSTWHVPVAALPAGPAPVPVRAYTEADRPALEAAWQRVAMVAAGECERDAWLWSRVFSRLDRAGVPYVVGPPGTVEGFVSLHRTREGSDAILQALDCWATTADGWRWLAAFLAGHRTIFDAVRFEAPPSDPWLAWMPGPVHRLARLRTWMLRFLDLPRALRARGYADGLAGELHLEVADDLLPGNAGRFVLAVADGRGTVTPGGWGEVAIHVRDLAPLYTGHASAEALAADGRCTGPAPALALASSLFAGPAPHIRDVF